jgi:membrane-bound inhibitor of C-type lysozyme
METGSKVFTRQSLEGIEIKENRFGFEPEIVAKIARKGLRVYEVGISYSGRTYAEGKKIRWTDGVRAIYCIVKYSRGPR